MSLATLTALRCAFLKGSLHLYVSVQAISKVHELRQFHSVYAHKIHKLGVYFLVDLTKAAVREDLYFTWCAFVMTCVISSILY